MDDSTNYAMLINGGAVYTFNDHWQLQASLGRTLRRESLGGPKLIAQLLVQWNFW